MAALTALGATGKAEEITKIPTGGRLATPVVVAVGLGAGARRRQGLRRAPGLPGAAAPRGRRGGPRADRRHPGRARRIAIALPAGEPDEAEAVALGVLLGGYSFRKYRTTAAGPATSS